MADATSKLEQNKQEAKEVLKAARNKNEETAKELGTEREQHAAAQQVLQQTEAKHAAAEQALQRMQTLQQREANCHAAEKEQLTQQLHALQQAKQELETTFASASLHQRALESAADEVVTYADVF